MLLSLYQEEEKAAAAATASTAEAPKQYVRALHSFEPAADQEGQLGLTEGEVVEVVELPMKDSPEWAMGRVGDKEGFFPANYVSEPVEAASPESAAPLLNAGSEAKEEPKTASGEAKEEPKQSTEKYVKALHQFDGQGEGQLSTQAGDVLRLVQENGEWYTLELVERDGKPVANAEQGFVPVSFVEATEWTAPVAATVEPTPVPTPAEPKAEEPTPTAPAAEEPKAEEAKEEPKEEATEEKEEKKSDDARDRERRLREMLDKGTFAKSQFDWEGDAAQAQIDLKKGDILFVEEGTGDWGKGRVIYRDGAVIEAPKLGYYPTSYVETVDGWTAPGEAERRAAVDAKFAAADKPQGEYMEALYDVNPADEGQIALKTGDIILLVPTDGASDDWAHGKVVHSTAGTPIDGKEGFFPRNHTQPTAWPKA